MEIDQLYKKLCASYTDENLNRITAKIIELYKTKNFDSIFQLSNTVARYGLLHTSENVARCFSRLLMIYHPDRGNHYRDGLHKHFQRGEFDELTRYRHIFEMASMEHFSVISEPDYEDIDYHPEYVWDYEVYEENSFHDIDEENYVYTEVEAESFFDDTDISFYEAVKRKMYGNLDIDMPPYYLEDLDEIEMADYELNNLDGIEYCKHLVKLDLSGNRISDLNGIQNLNRLEELYINENELNSIDVCFRLKRLRLLDVAHNVIEDINHLIELPHLEYVNLVGNPVPEYQIDKMRAQGVIVII